MTSEWKVTTIGKFCPFKYGKGLPERDRRAGEFAVYSSAGLVGSHTTPFVEGAGIIIGRKGTVGSVNFSSKPFWPIDTSFYIEDEPEVRDVRFTYYLLKTLGLDLMNTDSAVPGLNRDNAHAKVIKVPPLWMQKKIADFFGSLDDRITLLRETNQTLEAIAQALFKSWFVDFDPVRAKAEGKLPNGIDASTAALFPDAFEETESGIVPKGWQVVPFLDVCDLLGGSQPPAAVFIDELKDGYVRLLQIRDFSTDSHKTYIPDTNKLKKVTEDDVLIGRYGSASGDKAKDSLGRVCRGLSGSYNVALMKLNPLLVGREFALQLVNDPRFYNYLQGVSSKAVQSGFSKSELGQYRVVLPGNEILLKFEQYGVATWESIKARKQKIETLTNLRGSLLPRLISGQLRISDAEAELEKVIA